MIDGNKDRFMLLFLLNVCTEQVTDVMIVIPCHGGAEEDVDDEHDQEEDPEGHAQVQHPRRARTAVATHALDV